MTHSDYETELIVACQQGDREAFRQLFELHQARVWTIALHYTGNEATAQDIAQQVFLKLFSSLSQFRHNAKFATWLYRLVVNVCLDEQRKSRRFLSLGFGDLWRRDDDEEECADDVLPPVAPLQDVRISQHELSAAMRAALDELAPPIRMALLLKYFADFSYEEIAAALNCSMGTVASRMSRGHKALAIKLVGWRGKAV
ncbi:MAG: RNA polymerase sigma factor [Acidobacteria bacterium]|nr:RNA polymerase sigma factor [Acidobacteriota bacterium]